MPATTKIYKTRCFVVGDNAYPKQLSKIPDAPKVLYYKGFWDESMFKNVLAVVGSRKISNYGHAVLNCIFSELSSRGLTVISGFMRGVDSLAHDLAVGRNIPTIAVMPCGIETIYPEEQSALYATILNSGGLVISEYAGYEQPKNWMFVKRNRIIAALCHALLVVEAGENSGSLVTYDYAKKFGKKIFAVPGDIFSINQKGICQMFAQGATPLVFAHQINETFGLSNNEPIFTNKVMQLTVSQQEVYKEIAANPRSINDLVKKLNMSISAINSCVTSLLLNGAIKEIGGVLHAVKS